MSDPYTVVLEHSYIFSSHYYSVTKHPGSRMCLYVMFAAPHIIYVHMLSVMSELELNLNFSRIRGGLQSGFFVCVF